MTEVKAMSDKVQFHQEMGGLVGRVLLAVLLIVGISRVALLKVFQIPALIILPLTYFELFSAGGDTFLWAYAVCGLVGPSPSSATSASICQRSSRCICVAPAAASRTWAVA